MKFKSWHNENVETEFNLILIFTNIITLERTKYKSIFIDCKSKLYFHVQFSVSHSSYFVLGIETKAKNKHDFYTSLYEKGVNNIFNIQYLIILYNIFI